MSEIKVTVNLVTFALALIVWLIIGGIKLYGVDVPDDINTIFAIITGVILTIIQGFKEGVTFSGSTSTDTTTLTTTKSPATGEPASPPVIPQQINYGPGGVKL